ncbi:hypothetical protein ACFVY1_45245, partial [Streptomyces sp. NPDC058293]|uniref:hypothetical protein n=1 Tax=Streptomyces sp. NPDC058293 TaxID=3346429 RepID=UPI0036E8C284
MLLSDLGQVLAIGFRPVPHQRLLERDIEVVTAGDTTMGTDQAGDHVAVAVGVQDSLDHHVVTGIERVAGDRVDQADVGTSPRVVDTLTSGPGGGRERVTDYGDEGLFAR